MIASRQDRPGEGEGPIIQLRCLGDLELRRGDADLRAILAQPKRLALLVRLAVEPAGSYQRRETLLPLFWPESSERRARAALRQAVRFLRQHLGEGVLLGRGREELGIAEERLYCDVVRFQRALDTGSDEEALELYHGELLSGFFLSDAPEFERWLEEERRQLRRAAIDAALRLSESAEAAGDPAAIEWVRRASELDPVNETFVRRLIELLDQIGNRAAAVEAYEAFTQRLREELDLEPAPETRALIEVVRDRIQPTAAPGRAAFGAAPESLHDGLDPRRVLVKAFENRTGSAELDAVGKMAGDWVAQGLAELPDVEVVPPLIALGVSGERETVGEKEGLEGTRAIAEKTGAGTIVTGAYYLDDSELRFEARIADAVRGKLLPGPDPITVPRDEPLKGIEELEKRLTTCVAPLLSPRAVHVRSAARPPTYEAYRSYMEGLQLFVRGDWAEALPYFRGAVEMEPDYALPRIVSSISLWNLGDLAEAERIALEAQRRRDSIAPFERAVLDNVLAWLRGDWSAAQDAARRQAEVAPGSIPHFQVAEEARRLNRPGEALAVLTRLDPERGELKGWLFYWIELATAHHMLHEHEPELKAADRARELHRNHPAAILLQLRALAALGRLDRLRRVLDEALASPRQQEPRPGALLREAALELRAHGYLEPAEQLLEDSLAWYRERPASERSSPGYRRELARACYHAGQCSEAEEIFQTLVSSHGRDSRPIAFHHAHLQGHLDEGYLAVLALRRNDATETSRWRERLENLDRPFVYGSQWYWLAAVAALEGDRRTAVSFLRRAFAEGLPFQISLHTDPHLAALRDYPPFESLMRPQG